MARESTPGASDLKSAEAARGAFTAVLPDLHDRRRRRELAGRDRGRRAKDALESIDALLDGAIPLPGESGLAWIGRFREILEELRARVASDPGDEDGDGGGTVLDAMNELERIRGRME